MDALDHLLREDLARRAGQADGGGPGPRPADRALAERVLARTARVRRRRATAAWTGAGVAVLGVVALVTVLLPGPHPRAADPAGTSRRPVPVTGPPRVPLVVADGTVLSWDGDRQRTLRLPEDAQAVAAVPGGLLTVAGAEGRLEIVAPDGRTATPLATGAAPFVAVDADGTRAGVVLTAAGGRRNLAEVDLGDGRVLRRVPIAPPLAGAAEPVLPVAWSEGALVLTVGEGSAQRAALWEPGEDQVVGRLDAPQALDAAAGHVALRRAAAGRCGTDVAALSSPGAAWQLCREVPVGFSPGGRWFLATDAVGTGLVVHRARDGKVVARFPLDHGVRASGWESGDAVLAVTVDGDRTVVLRCDVRAGGCATAVRLPGTDRIPQPLARRPG